jgi:hypothetical protein
MKSKLNKLYEELRDLYATKDKLLKKIGALEGKRCTARFSLCLDCRFHNDCPRYSKHLEEIL